jgi:shikimate dehydrogenase
MEAKLVSKFLVGLIGEGIEHSLTPDLHMREARAMGLEYEYQIIDVLDPALQGKSIDWLLAQARAAGFDAVNITFPFKQKAIALLESFSPEVGQLQSTNLVLNLQNKAHGENTDWTGFEFALNSALHEADRDLVIQVGVGGAGSATAFALLRWGVKHLVLADLNPERATELANRYGQFFPNQQVEALPMDQALELLPKVSGVVQATPIGMYTHPGLPFAIDGLNPAAWVADVVYRPMETQLIAAARAAGHIVVPGGLMAVGQAVDSLRLITGLQPDAHRMMAHFAELLNDETVLTRARGLR